MRSTLLLNIVYSHLKSALPALPPAILLTTEEIASLTWVFPHTRATLFFKAEDQSIALVSKHHLIAGMPDIHFLDQVAEALRDIYLNRIGEA